MSDSQEEIYYVERILGHKIQRGKRYFLIKWIGKLIMEILRF